MAVSKATVYRTSDGKLFESESLANQCEENILVDKISSIFRIRKLDTTNPLILELSIFQAIIDNSKQLEKMLHDFNHKHDH